MQPARAKVAGHPIHPMLIVFPIGLYLTSFVFDLVYLGTNDPFWYRMAFWVMLIGFIGNLAAAFPGFVDYMAIPPKTETRKVALYHMGVGLTIAVLYLLNLLLRNWGTAEANELPWIPVLLNLFGAGLIGIQGWLGGELVYRFGIGVEERREVREERYKKVI